MAKIGLEVQSKHFMKQLGKKGNQLQQVAADTLNESATEMRKNYNTSLRNKTKRKSKFTKNASRVLKSNPVSRGGQPRQLNKLNSKVVVRNMKGGKQHYLAKLEEGNTSRGSAMTRGKVAVPLTSARTGGSISRGIAASNRLTKSKTQTLKIRGKKIGVRGDKRPTGGRYKTPGQRWAVLYGSSKRGKINGDITKPFYMIDNNKKQGIFKMVRGRIMKIRKLEKNTVKSKPVPYFKRAVKTIPPREIQKIFIKNAKRKLGR